MKHGQSPRRSITPRLIAPLSNFRAMVDKWLNAQGKAEIRVSFDPNPQKNPTVARRRTKIREGLGSTLRLITPMAICNSC